MGFDLRTAALTLRLKATAAQRRRRLKSLSLQGAAPLVVLFYHRVADRHANDWTISRAQFAHHLDLVSATYEWIDLAELQQRVRTGHSRRPAAHLTFDDGYAENCEFALPELVRRGIPTTYFVSLAHVQTGQPFAHDVAQGQPLAVNTLDQLRDLAAEGIEIGCHTRTHCHLGRLVTPDGLHSEITGCAAELSALLQQPVRYFAFPYGLPEHLSQAAIAEVARSGMQGFCSAYGGYNLPGRDAFHIRRIHGDPDTARLLNWLSFDARKVAREPSITYTLPPQPPHC